MLHGGLEKGAGRLRAVGFMARGLQGVGFQALGVSSPTLGFTATFVVVFGFGFRQVETQGRTSRPCPLMSMYQGSATVCYKGLLILLQVG